MTREKRIRTAQYEVHPLATIPASTFKATCLELMDDLAARHAEIVVTKHGRPVVKVGPVSSMPASPLGFLRSTVIRHAANIGPDRASWQESTSDPLIRRKR